VTSPRAGGFAGELGLVGLFDIAQLLVLNRATGVLVVTAQRRTGYLYFEDGRLVNAVDDAHGEGENAAYSVFAWREGRFEFRPEPPSGRALIEQTTQSVMLEAARRMDEAAAAGAEPEHRQADRLRETQDTLESLRDVFKSLARETGAALASGGISVSRLYGIQGPDDRVLLRPGQPTRLRVDGVWIAGSGSPLTREDYQQVHAELMAASSPEEPGAIAAPADDARERRDRAPHGRRRGGRRGAVDPPDHGPGAAAGIPGHRRVGARSAARPPRRSGADHRTDRRRDPTRAARADRGA
jgi:hypothetical protein